MATSSAKQNTERLRFEDLSILSRIVLSLSQREKSVTEIVKEISLELHKRFSCTKVIPYLFDSSNFELKALFKDREFPRKVRCTERRIELLKEKELGFSPFQKDLEKTENDDNPVEKVLSSAFFHDSPLVFFPELQRESIRLFNEGSLLITAIRTRNRPWGLLCLKRGAGQSVFSVVEQEIIDLIATQMGLLIENHELNQRFIDKISILEAFSNFSHEINKKHSLIALSKISFQFIKDTIGFDAALIFLNYSEECKNFWSHDLNSFQKNKIRDVIKKISLDQGELPEASDVKEGGDSLFCNEELSSFLAVPLLIEEKRKGYIVLSREKLPFSRNDLSILLTCSNILSQACQNSLKTSRMARKIEEQSVLFEISQTMTSTLNLDEVLKFISEISGEMGDCDLVALNLFEKNTFKLRHSFGEKKDLFQELDIDGNDPLIKSAFESQKPFAVENVKPEQNYFKNDRIFKDTFKSFIMVPILQRKMPMGMLILFYKKQRRFPQNYLRFLQTMAGQAAIAIENANLFESTQENFLDTIKTLAAAIEAKDPYTMGHCEKVLEYSEKIGKKIGMDGDELENLRIGALLHDIGKIGIDDSILKKPAALTTEEYFQMKSHPFHGSSIMNTASFLARLAPIAYHHHERYDGKGYPDGLVGEQIPLAARIVTIADSYDVMTSDRVYRKGMSAEEAVEELYNLRGFQFDPDLVMHFFHILKRDYDVKVTYI
ncbi:HD domain-containing phosphohydrolase [Candidatus Riflebacteria bacterium]